MFLPYHQLISITGEYVAFLVFLLGLSACLYFPSNFLAVSYNCFMFPWAAESSASLSRLYIKFSLSVFMLFVNAMFASAYCFRVDLAALDRLLFITPLFSFVTFTLLIVSVEAHSLFWHFFFHRISLHVLVHISFICCHWVSMYMFSSSIRSCRASRFC